MTDKAESSMRNKILSKETLLPVSAVVILASAIASFFLSRADAAEARAGVQKNIQSIEMCRTRIEALERTNAANEQRLINIEKMLDKIDKKLP